MYTIRLLKLNLLLFLEDNTDFNLKKLREKNANDLCVFNHPTTITSTPPPQTYSKCYQF